VRDAKVKISASAISSIRPKYPVMEGDYPNANGGGMKLPRTLVLIGATIVVMLVQGSHSLIVQAT